MYMRAKNELSTGRDFQKLKYYWQTERQTDRQTDRQTQTDATETCHATFVSGKYTVTQKKRGVELFAITSSTLKVMLKIFLLLETAMNYLYNIINVIFLAIS